MLVNSKLIVKETCLFLFPKNSLYKGYFIIDISDKNIDDN